MASMSPPASSDAPTPVKKPRGRPAGGAGGGSKKKNANNNNEGGDTSTPRSSTGGGGGGRGRKKRQSTVDSHGASTPAASGSGGPLSMNTPGGNSSHAPSPGIANIASILEDEAIRGNREGSQLSASTTRRRGATGRGETATQMGDGDADDDDEDDDDEDDEDEGFIGEHAFDEQAKERAEAKEALRLLLDQFGPEQLERYETYRRAGLQNASVRRLVNHVLQQSCTPSIVLAFRGLSKVFIGEIVELARQVQAEANETGPITPDHLREAYARYRAVKDKRGSSRSKLFVR